MAGAGCRCRRDRVWELTIPPSNNRDWQSQVAETPYVEINGDRVVKDIGYPRPWDWQILINGFIAERAYELGEIDTSLPFPVRP
jgi:hypothetical protein